MRQIKFYNKIRVQLCFLIFYKQNLSFPEARDRLLARIKEDNNFMQQNDKRIKDIKKIIENYEKKIKELQVDLEVNKFI
jgi:intraflagellar transport protein 74